MGAVVVIPPRPSVPPPYVAGTVNVPANQPIALLELIHLQVNRDCPGTSVEFMLSPDPNNQAPVWIGAYMAHAYAAGGGDTNTPGPVSNTSFGYALTPMGNPRIYRSSYPGTSTAIGVIQVFSQVAAKLHVEVQE